MSINRFFEDVLGANVKNQRWSWGAFAPATNRVFLRIWQDEVKRRDGVGLVPLCGVNEKSKRPGATERRGHVQAMLDGAHGFGIVCVAADPSTTGTRRIASFDHEEAVVFGKPFEEDDCLWAPIVGTAATASLARRQTGSSTLDHDLRSLLANRKIENTTKEALINARVGQGAFRSAVLAAWDNRCAVTGTTVREAVRASHIKPWRDCNDEERLDPYNGLPLIATLDALFDAGLISFEESGGILVSSILSDAEHLLLGLEGLVLATPPLAQSIGYLRYHLDTVFLR